MEQSNSQRMTTGMEIPKLESMSGFTGGNQNWLLVQHQAEQIRLIFLDHQIKERVKLRQQIQFSRFGINVDTRNNNTLFTLFPEEIWVMMLQKVKSPEDGKNCLKTCPFFGRLMQKGIPLILFEKVLPFICKFSSKSDVLKMRLVCKFWQKSIDTFLETSLGPVKPQADRDGYYFKAWKRILPTSNLDFEYDFLDRSRRKYSAALQVVRSKNPFIGRSLILKLTHSDPRYSPTEIFKIVLPKFGSFIFHLKLHYGENAADISVSFLLSIFSLALKGCENLRTFCLSGLYNEGTLETTSDDLSEADLPEHKFLESLTLDSDFEKFGKVVDKLAEKYSSQLKYFYACKWNSELYHLLTWNCVQQLCVNTLDVSNELYQSLCKLQAPNLLKLSVNISNGQDQLRNVLRVVKSFPSLVSLELKFLSWVQSLNQEVSQVAHTIGCFKSIEDITVTNSAKLDFLLFFPLIRRLQIIHYNRNINKHNEGLIDMLFWSNEVNSQENDCTLMYKSNIWEILPNLEILEDVNRNIKRIHTRQGYEAKLTRRQICDKMFQLARKEANVQNRGRKLELKKQLQDVAQEISKSSEKCSDKITSNQILEFVLPFLSRAETLLCRSICKNWKVVIDTLLKERKIPKLCSLDLENGVSVQNTQIIHKFHIPFRNKEEEKANTNGYFNPFVGRHILIELTHHKNSWSFDERLQYNKILENFGTHIWHLTISGGQKGTWICRTEYYHKIIIFVLRNCKNLRTFSIHNLQIDLETKEPVYQTVDELPDLPYLQSLDFGSIGKAGSVEQMLLLSKYHGHLKALKVDCLQLSSLAKDTLWENLVELNITSEYATVAVNNLLCKKLENNENRNCINELFTLNAPNLRKLTLNIRGGRDELTILILLTRHFPKLSTLILYFLDEPLNCSEEEIAKMTPELISSTNLVCLNLTVSDKMICYDFLYFFPFIRTLSVSEIQEVGLPERKKENDEEISFSRDVVNICRNPFDKEHDMLEVNGVNFSRYVPEIYNKQYSSGLRDSKNVWQILPHLCKLEINKQHRFTKEEFLEEKRFDKKVRLILIK